ncbi:glycosyltransferase family 2 protein [Aquitalea sp. S1-19]|nr:glycosyltransferase family 2 protein [Aquitalea sp. S1-19]
MSFQLEQVALSVLIVAYNNEPEIASCIGAVRTAAAEVTHEILVVDNASHDGTLAVLRDEADIQLIASPVNLGFAAGNNLAAHLACGRYLALVNPDARPEPGALAQAVHWMDAHPEVALAGGRLLSPDGVDQPSARSFPSLLNDLLVISGLSSRFPHSRFFGRVDRSWADPATAAAVDWVPGAFAVVRVSALAGEALFDERFFLYFEEVDLCRRLHARGQAVWYQPQWRAVHIGGVSSRRVAGAHFNRHGSQLSLWRMRSALLYYRKHHGWLGALGTSWFERIWHRLRVWRNALQHRPGGHERRQESEALQALLLQAWDDTAGGRASPPRPW